MDNLATQQEESCVLGVRMENSSNDSILTNSFPYKLVKLVE